MSVGGVNSQYASAGSASTSSTGGSKKNELGKDAFLQLLVTQLQNQDPLEPLSNEDFIAQTAQFTSVESLEKINENLLSSRETSNMTNSMLAASMIGKHIKVTSDQISLHKGETSSLEFNIPRGTDVFVTIRDQFGRLVKRERISGKDGEYAYSWDGKASDGKLSGNGVYSVKVQTADSNGNPSQEIPTRATGEVSSVKFMGGEGKVLVGKIEIALSDILEVKNINE